MDFNATIDLIIKDLREASDIIDDLKKYPGVPALQVELAKMKCKSAGEVIAILKSLKENPVSPERASEAEEKVQKQPEPAEEKSPVAREITRPAREVKKTGTAVPEAESQPLTKAAGSGKSGVKGLEPSILADQFSHLSGSINEQLGTLKNEGDISDILNTRHLTSLSEAIGVNDKFLFIREIFNGNQATYSQALSRLENAENIKDARAVIMSYTGESGENEAVKQLLDLVKRKLPSDE